MRIEYTATRAVRAAIDRIGRTEDAQFSVSGRRLAVAGAANNRLLVLKLDAALETKSPKVALSDFFEIESESLAYPHGLFWLDDQSLIVANRSGDIAIFELPAEWPATSSLHLQPVRSLGADCLVRTPGSLSVSQVGLGLIELLVCNNYVDNVSRHLLDQRNGFAVLANEILLDEGLEVPDGVAHTPSGSWIAVSNHMHNRVDLFYNDAKLNNLSAPDGKLLGAKYPHGLRFSGDGRALLVADAGAPMIYVYLSDDGAWGGVRNPSRSVRVLDEETFERGHFNQAEGGPKGIGLTGDGRLLVTSCDTEPLALWDARAFGVEPTPGEIPADAADEVERTRDVFVKYLSAADRRVQRTAEAIRRSRDWELQMVVGGQSSRITDPLHRTEATWRNRPDGPLPLLAGSAGQPWHAGSYQEEVTEQGLTVKLKSYIGAVRAFPNPHVALEAELPEPRSDWGNIMSASVAIARRIASVVADGELLERAAAEVESHSGEKYPWPGWTLAFALASGVPGCRVKWETLPEARMLLRIACPYQQAATNWAVMGLHLLWLARDFDGAGSPDLETAAWERRLAQVKTGLPDVRLIPFHTALTARRLPWTWDSDTRTSVGYGSRQRLVQKIPPDCEAAADQLAEMQLVVPIYTIAGTGRPILPMRRLVQLLDTSGLRLCAADSQMVIIDGRTVGREDSIGGRPARGLLRRRQVDAAVFEIVSAGLARSGFPFEQTEVAVLLNVADRPDRDEGVLVTMADVLALTLAPARLAVLNLDDAQCRRLGEQRPPDSVVWFSAGASPDRLEQLSRSGAGAVGVLRTADGTARSLEFWRNGANAGSLTLDGVYSTKVGDELLAAVAAGWFGPIEVKWDGLLQRILAPIYVPRETKKPASMAEPQLNS